MKRGPGSLPLRVMKLMTPPIAPEPVQRRHRPPDHLDPLDVSERVHAEIKGAAGVGSVVQRHPIAQHEHLVGVGAANEDAGIASRPAGLADAVCRAQSRAPERDWCSRSPRSSGGRSQKPRPECPSTGVGTRVAVTTTSWPSGTDCWAWAGVSAVAAKSAARVARRMRSSVGRGTGMSGPVAGDDSRRRVLPRCPGAPRPLRARSLDAGRSPGSRVADHRSAPPAAAFSCPDRGQWHRGRTRRLQLRGQPRTCRIIHPASRVPVSALAGHQHLSRKSSMTGRGVHNRPWPRAGLRDETNPPVPLGVFHMKFGGNRRTVHAARRGSK